MKTTLFKIEREYIDIINEVEALEGELTTELEYKLKINESQLQQKSIAYLSVIKESETFVLAIDEEIKRLQSLKKRKVKTIDRLKESLLNAVKLFGDLDFGLTKFGTRKSESIEVKDVNQLPKEYKTIKTTEQADKKAIKEALKQGKEIKGCSIKTNINLKIN